MDKLKVFVLEDQSGSLAGFMSVAELLRGINFEDKRSLREQHEDVARLLTGRQPFVRLSDGRIYV